MFIWLQILMCLSYIQTKGETEEKKTIHCKFINQCKEKKLGMTDSQCIYYTRKIPCSEVKVCFASS